MCGGTFVCLFWRLFSFFFVLYSGIKEQVHQKPEISFLIYFLKTVTNICLLYIHLLLGIYLWKRYPAYFYLKRQKCIAITYGTKCWKTNSAKTFSEELALISWSTGCRHEWKNYQIFCVSDNLYKNYRNFKMFDKTHYDPRLFAENRHCIPKCAYQSHNSKKNLSSHIQEKTRNSFKEPI